MREQIKKIYFLFFAGIMVLLVYLLFTVGLEVRENTHKSGFETITAYTVQSVTDASAPVKIKNQILLPPLQVDGGYRCLMFYTIHQNVEVYVGDERIYLMNPAYYNDFGKTPGCVWNEVVITDDFAGKEILVELTPIYSSGVDYVPFFYFGEKKLIVRKILGDSALPLFLSFITILLGIILVLYVVYNRHNSEVDQGTALRGAFAVHVGLWRMFDTSAIKFMFPNNPAVSMVPFLALSCAVVPFVLFFSDMMTTKKSRIWDTVAGLGLGASALVLFLQYKNVIDLRESFGITVFMIVLIAICTALQDIYEYRHAGWNPVLKRNTFFVAACVVCVCLDLGIYYFSGYSRTSSFGMLALLGYIISISVNVGKAAGSLAEEGRRSTNYERMAYHDQLTGMFNRTALARDTDRYAVNPEHSIMLVFDLNDLKKCNDTLGHEQGDIYIKESARLIETIFGTIGRCYRTGGDEFCCFVENGSRKECKEKVEELRAACDDYNAKSKQLKIVIACGYAAFDGRIDYDLSETIKRADHMMYEDKARLKKYGKDFLGE